MALRVKIIATDKLSGTLLRIGKSVMRLGVRFAKMGVLAAGAIAAISIKLSMDFQKGLKEISTLLSDLTNNELKAMGKELKTLAGSTGLILSELTKAKYDIISSGFNDVAESLHVLTVASNLAVGGNVSVADSAKILTNVLNAYGLSAEYASDVSDVLFTTVKLGVTTTDELSKSLGKVLGTARAAGVGFDTVGAIMATLTSTIGGTAENVTALRGMLLALAAPTEEAARKMQEAGKTAIYFNSGAMDLVATLKQYSGLSLAQIRKLIPDITAANAVIALTQNMDKLIENLEKMDDRMGSTATAVEKMQTAFKNKFAQMKNHLQAFMIAIGDALIIKLDPIITAANKILARLGEIGWDNIGKAILENMNIIGDALIATAKIIGRETAEALWNGIKTVFDKIKPLTQEEWFAKVWAATGDTSIIVKPVVDEINDIYEILFKALEASALKYKEKAGGIGENTAQTIINKMLRDVAAAGFGGGDDGDGDGSVLKELGATGSQLLTTLDMVLSNYEKLKAFKLDVSFDPLGDGNKDWVPAVLSNYEKAIQGYNDYKDQMQQITNAVGDVYNNLLGLRKAQIQSELDAQIGAVLASGLAEEEKQAKISNLREVARQKEIAAAKKLKPIKLAQAISGTALAVINALQTKPFIPLGIAAGILAGIAGAAQIATIVAQPYARGGFVRMGGNIPASDTIPTMLAPNEIVSTAAASERFGAEISRLNQLAEGGGFGSEGGTFNITINALDGADVERVIKRNPNSFARGFNDLKRRNFI